MSRESLLQTGPAGKEQAGQAGPWAVAAIGIGVAGALLASASAHRIRPGSRVSVTVTLIRQDEGGLACRSDASFGETRCAFVRGGQPAKAVLPLRPFATTDHQVILLAGVFEEPHVAAWLAEARRSEDDARVRVTCDCETLGTVGAAEVRWTADGPFLPERDAFAARVSACVAAP